jgi:hypothetical protein
MTKKLLSRAAIILITICILFPSVQVAHGGIIAITDINTHWAKNVINSWIAKGFTNGYPDNTFKPDNSITRAEFIALINRSFKFTEKSDIAFTDAAVKDWFYEDAAKAVRAGYTAGCTETMICPNKQITRREAAVMISRLLHLGDSVVGDSSMFVDSSEFADWGMDEIGVVAATKIMSGYLDAATESYSFKPNNKITRAEAIASLDRTLSYRDNTFNLAGTYGPATGSNTVNGDVIINVPNVILQNTIINKNLTITDKVGEGEVTLKNVVVKGTTTINGGGANSIHLENVTLESVIVNKAAGPIRVVAEGSTRISNTTLKSSATLEEDSSLKSQGFQTVNLPGTESGSPSVVTLKGAFEKVILDGQGIQMTLPSGSIQSMTVSEQATANSLNMSASATVNVLALNAIMSFTGQGTILSATLGDGAIDSPFEKQPTKRIDSTGAIIAPPTAPVITSVVAVNSGNNLGLGINDSVVITFDQNTNKPAVTAANLSTWVSINSGHSFGTSLLNTDITWNDTGNILTIKFSSVLGTTFAVGDSIKVQAAAGLKNSANSTAASVATSAASTGTFTAAPSIISVDGANTGNNDGLGIGDSVSITFDQNTNRSAIKAATLNTMLVLNNGHSFGALLDRDINWNSAGNILTIAFSNVTTTTFAIGDTVTVTASANITSLGGAAVSASTSGPSSGSFYTFLEVKSVVAANTGGNLGLAAGDTITITFSTATNMPVFTAADFKNWFTIMSGHSFGNLVNGNITWTSNTVMQIKYTDVTGATFVPGDSILISLYANIRDINKKYPLNYILTPPSTGSFSFAPEITSVYASNTGNNAGMGVGDSISIVFNQPTNRAVITGSILNTLLLVSGGHSFGTGIANNNIYWNATGEILTINLNTITGVTFVVGDSITPTKAANIRDANGLSLESVKASPVSTGNFSPIPATPTITSVIAVGAGGSGLDVGDSIVITFNQATNQPNLSQALNTWITLAESGHQFGPSTVTWTTPYILTIKFTKLPLNTDLQIAIGDTLTISADAKIKDASGVSNSYAGPTAAISGSFSPAPKITKVEAVNTSQTPGFTGEDSIKITFDMAMYPIEISADEIKSWFTVKSSNGVTHSLGTDIYTGWENEDKTLVITFINVTAAVTFVPGGPSTSNTGDTIQPTVLAELFDASGDIKVSQIKSPPSTGSFTTAPKISYFTSEETYNETTGDVTGILVTIVFDQSTNKSIDTASKLLNGLIFKSPAGALHKFGSIVATSVLWSTTNTVGDTLSFKSTGAYTIENGDSITINSAANLKDVAQTTPASTGIITQ